MAAALEPPLLFLPRILPENVMNTLRCPHLDRLLSKLVDSYSRLEDRDMAAVLTGTEVPAEVDALHVAMAEHRTSCPVCIRIDRTRQEKSVFNAPTQRVQP